MEDISENNLEVIPTASYNYTPTYQQLQPLEAYTSIVDVDLHTLLLSWNLEHLYNHLINEKITVNILKIMKLDHLRELVKGFKMGEKIAFEHHVELWREELDIPMNLSGMNCFLHAASSPSTKKSDYSENRLLRRQSSSPYSIPAREETPEASDTKMVTLSDILSQSRKGMLLKDFYQAKNKLNEEQRTMLINVISNYFEYNNLHMSLNTSYRLENEIVDHFPTEKKEYYREGKRGKIYTKCSNQKRNLKSVYGETEKSNKKSTSVKTFLKNIVPEKDAEEVIHSLKFDNLSSDEYIHCWQACAHHRINQLMKETTNLTDFFKLWPEYKGSNGARLIDKDFNLLFEDSGGIMTDSTLKLELIYKFLQRNNHVKDASIKTIINSITSENVKTGNDSVIFKTLWSLHGYLTPTSKTIRKDQTGKKRTIKHTIRDSQESFVFVGRSVQQLEDHVEYLKTRMENIQPFILAIGNESFTSFESFFIYIDGVKLCFNSFLRAMDVCFKAIHLFNLEYPIACSSFWVFIECYFYNLKKNPQKTTKVSILLEELKSEELKYTQLLPK